ncbi:MAG: hypothetical protein ACK4PI_13420 [Tepidisphaerales bacterium]
MVRASLMCTPAERAGVFKDTAAAFAAAARTPAVTQSREGEAVMKCVVAAVAAAVLTTAAAQAAVILTIESGSFTQTITGTDLVNNTSVAVPGYTLTTNIGLSNTPGTPSEGFLQITTITVRNVGAASPLKITLTATDYSLPGGAGDTLVLLSSVGGTISNNGVGLPVTFQSFADSTNAAPATEVAAPLQTYMSVGGLLESFNNDVTASFTRGSGNYSLSNVLHLNLAPGAQANISGTTVTFIPEPAALGLLAAAAPLAARRRRA